jgi:hypothetical protein
LTFSAKHTIDVAMDKQKQMRNAFLHKYLPEVQEYLLGVKKQKGLGKLAVKYAFDQARFSEFIAGTRLPSRYYIWKFIQKGDIPVQRFLQGKKLNELSEEEQEFWAEMGFLEDKELMGLLKEFREKGLNAKNALKGILNK